MERAVTYSVVARKKPNDLEGSAKYYALATGTRRDGNP